MAFHIRDSQTDILVRALAKQLGVGITDAVKMAVSGELKRGKPDMPLRDRLRKIAAPLASYPPTERLADKAFFDTMSGD